MPPGTRRRSCSAAMSTFGPCSTTGARRVLIETLEPVPHSAPAESGPPAARPGLDQPRPHHVVAQAVVESTATDHVGVACRHQRRGVAEHLGERTGWSPPPARPPPSPRAAESRIPRRPTGTPGPRPRLPAGTPRRRGPSPCAPSGRGAGPTPVPHRVPPFPTPRGRPAPVRCRAPRRPARRTRPPAPAGPCEARPCPTTARRAWSSRAAPPTAGPWTRRRPETPRPVPPSARRARRAGSAPNRATTSSATYDDGVWTRPSARARRSNAG